MNPEKVEKQRKLVQQLINEQNVPMALLGSALAAAALAVAWKVLGDIEPNSVGLFLAGPGFAVGLLVRYLGRGIWFRFRAIAVFFTLVTLFLAAVLNAQFTGSLPVPAITIFLLVVTGLAGAALVSTRRLHEEELNALFRHGIAARFSSMPYNSWLVVITGSTLLTVALVIAIALGADYVRNNRQAQSDSDADYDPREKGRALGRSWGRSFSAEDCKEMVAQRIRNCVEDQRCLQETPYVLDGCLSEVEARESSEQQ